ncbi:MAG: integrin alpha [Xanthomonadales bacterium]|nr:integrin alpha [Xanthomonadales bacterium]
MIVLRKTKQKRLALAISMALTTGAVYADFTPELELSDLNGTNGFVINGAGTFDESGQSVSSAGDINGDGISDLIIGAPYAAGDTDYSGTSYVVFGSGQVLPNPLNLSALDGSNGFVINGSSTYDYSGKSVSAAGDINGDGIDDLIIGAPGSSSLNEAYSGASYVVFGSDQPWAGSLDLSSLDGSNGFIINGAAEYDESGSSVSAAGDINGDGFDDLIIGAPYATIGVSYAGAGYVVFGSDQPWASSVNLSALNGSNGFVINGVGEGDGLGGSVSSAGDINADGFDDLIIGAIFAGVTGAYAGASYVVFGSDQGLPNPLNLSGLDGSDGFVINGVSNDDQAGTSVSTAGDINADGIDDLIVGASRADPNGANSGASYVVFGSDQPWSSSLNLSALNGSNGFVINGLSANDESGLSVSTAGDINFDGMDDLIIGAPLANSNGVSSGASYVVFGSDQAWVSSFDLSGLNGSNGFVINGALAGDNSGASVSAAGDINGDGFDDLITGAPLADPNGNYSGASYVVYGAEQIQNDDVIFADSFE